MCIQVFLLLFVFRLSRALRSRLGVTQRRPQEFLESLWLGTSRETLHFIGVNPHFSQPDAMLGLFNKAIPLNLHISLASSVSTKMSTLLGLSARQTVKRDSSHDVRHKLRDDTRMAKVPINSFNFARRRLRNTFTFGEELLEVKKT